MDDIESSVTDIQRILKARAGGLCPAIFPSQRVPRSIFDLVAVEDKEQLQKWLEAANISPDSIGFKTEFDYKKRVISLEPVLCADDIDRRLTSLERVMDAMVSRADQALLGLLSERFREWNGTSSTAAASAEEEGDALYEVCNLAYSLKIIMSNIPGITIMLGESTVPLAAGTSKFDKIFASLKRRPAAAKPSKAAVDTPSLKRPAPAAAASATKGKAPSTPVATTTGTRKNESSDSDSEEEDSDDGDNAESTNAGKRRKKRRGKK